MGAGGAVAVAKAEGDGFEEAGLTRDAPESCMLRAALCFGVGALARGGEFSLDDSRGDTRAERRHERHDHRLISKNGTDDIAENSEDALLCRDF